MKKLRVLVLMHEDHVPPSSLDGFTEKEILEWKAQFDVVTALQDIGHDVRPLGVSNDLGVLRESILEWKPHIAFNLLEEFHDVSVYDSHVISYLELMRQHYTGCNPRGLMVTHDKALSKKILAYHRIKVPRFAVFQLGRAVRVPKRLEYPLLVKSLVEEGSFAISQASIVHNEEKLRERVDYLHGLGTHAIAEEYIEGRELYAAILGNRRLEILPFVELVFGKLPDGSLPIATTKVKWDLQYRERHGITTRVVDDLSDSVQRKIAKLLKRIYRALYLSGYARIDLRLTPSGEVYVLEANPNADLSYGDEFSEAAEAKGYDYEALLGKILSLGRSYQAEWRLA